MKKKKKNRRAQKRCPDCLCWVHSRRGMCDCGYEFIAGFSTRKDEPKKVEVYKERGRGRKRCDGPGEPHYLGLRVFGTCPQCGIEIVRKEKQPPIKDRTDEAADRYRKILGFDHIVLVFTPNGKPPTAPKNFKNITAWLDKNVVYNGKLMYLSALRYWMRQIYGHNTEEYKCTCQQIDKWFKKLEKESLEIK